MHWHTIQIKLLAAILLIFSASHSVKAQPKSSALQNDSENITEISGNLESEKYEGLRLSKEIEAFLKSNLQNLHGITIQKEDFSLTGQDEFPFNIIIDKQGSYSEEKDSGTNQKKMALVLDFLQEDVFKRKEQFSDFINQIANRQFPYDLKILCASKDNPIINDKKQTTGTEAFVDSVSDPTSMAILAIRFTGDEKNVILTGVKGSASPAWLSKLICEAFEDAGEDYAYPHKFLSFFRLGWHEGDARLTSIIEHGIASIAINFTDSNGFKVLNRFLSVFNVTTDEEWDIHYTYFFLPKEKKQIWLTEKNFLSLGLIMIFSGLLILFSFSFVGEKGAKKKEEFINSWYMIPLSLLISFLSLILAQFLIQHVPFIKTQNPIIQAGIKLILSFVFLSFSFMAEERLHLPVMQFAFGYAIAFAAILNIMYFSIFDILLFILFGLEYLIIYFTKGFTNIPALIVTSILMLLPFVPYALTLVQYSHTQLLHSLTNTSIFGNFTLLMGVFPFHILWLKFLTRINIYAGIKGHSRRRVLITSGIGAIYNLLFSFAILSAISNIWYYTPERIESESYKLDFFEENLGTISANISKDEFSDLNSNHLEITSLQNAVRYSVKIHALNEQVPVYESLYNFSSGEDSDTVIFTIPDLPPKKITIDYACAANASSEIEIEAIYRTENKERFRIEKIKING